MPLEPLGVARVHGIGAPEIQRPNRGEDQANRMVHPIQIGSRLSEPGGRSDAELRELLQIAPHKVVHYPLLPLILIGPRPGTGAILRLPTDEAVERLVR